MSTSTSCALSGLPVRILLLIILIHVTVMLSLGHLDRLWVIDGLCVQFGVGLAQIVNLHSRVVVNKPEESQGGGNGVWSWRPLSCSLSNVMTMALMPARVMGVCVLTGSGESNPRS